MVIAAGGMGRRMRSRKPKQFLEVNGKPILQLTLEVFDRHPDVHEIVVVAPGDHVRAAESIIRRAALRKVSHVVVGGSERQYSVRNGLLSFEIEPEIVLVHDAVRPFIDRSVISSVIRKARRHGAAVVGVPVSDTLKVGRAGFYRRTLDRTNVWAVQTPQGFRFDLLLRAHRAAERSGYLGTDEASLVERLRVPVAIVEGSSRNIKITTGEDLALAKALLRS